MKNRLGYTYKKLAAMAVDDWQIKNYLYGSPWVPKYSGPHRYDVPTKKSVPIWDHVILDFNHQGKNNTYWRQVKAETKEMFKVWWQMGGLSMSFREFLIKSGINPDGDL